MSFLSILYTTLIAPLELFFETIFSISNRLIRNEGLSIIVLSITVNFLVLPLYKRADELQAAERDAREKMAPGIAHLKETFSGDKRFMILQTFYRQNHYSPIYALRSSASLLLQIPFFIAAYNLLSGMQSLKGMSFGFISDLGKEDALFMIGSFPVNILPILMTLINIISGFVYTKGHPVSEKLRVYGLALFFLILLYHSPSGLVFYWLLNNVFSLMKNIFYKLKDPKKILSIIAAAAGASLLLLTWTAGSLDMRQKVLLSILSLLLLLPFLSRTGKTDTPRKERPKDALIFFSGALLMSVLTGLLIPIDVISASPEEFINVRFPFDPSLHVLYTMCLAFGLWVLWGGILYFFMKDRSKSYFSEGIWLICGISIVDYLTAGTDRGLLSPNLQYEEFPVFKLSEYLINSLIVLVLVLAFHFFFKKFRTLVRIVLIAGIVGVIGLSAFSIRSVHQTYRSFRNRFTYSDQVPTITLSREGQNVVVLMLDRAIGPLVPYLLEEKPELKEQFDGFTYYPNTISYGGHTNLAAPALFGGYEYVPGRLNKRDTEKMSVKHNEALKVMPVLFGQNGYEVTIFDPPYAGYTEIPDLSIYSDYPEFHLYNTADHFNFFEGEMDLEEYSDLVTSFRNRNFFCYSLMKIAPVLLQDTFYDSGAYNDESSGATGSSGDAGSDGISNASDLVQKKDDADLTAKGYDYDFMEYYPELTHLSEITSIKDGTANTFLMMTNDTTHSPCLLQKPDYVPARFVDNTAFDTDIGSRYNIGGKKLNMSARVQKLHYHVNMASFLQLGKWFDYLREMGVYDNTRIILVSDHGYGAGYFDIKCHDEDLGFYMPLLMVKDFNSTGFSVCEDFMTNADTPVLATSDLISDPVNPFTGNPINSDKKAGPQLIMSSDCWDVSGNNGTRFLPAYWYVFEGDPYDPECWKYIGID